MGRGKERAPAPLHAPCTAVRRALGPHLPRQQRVQLARLLLAHRPQVHQALPALGQLPHQRHLLRSANPGCWREGAARVEQAIIMQRSSRRAGRRAQHQTCMHACMRLLAAQHPAAALASWLNRRNSLPASRIRPTLDATRSSAANARRSTVRRRSSDMALRRAEAAPAGAAAATAGGWAVGRSVCGQCVVDSARAAQRSTQGGQGRSQSQPRRTCPKPWPQASLAAAAQAASELMCGLGSADDERIALARPRSQAPMSKNFEEQLWLPLHVRRYL